MRIGAASTAILNVALLSFFIFQGLQSPFRKLGGSGGYPKNAALPGHDPVSGDIGEFAAFDPDSMMGGDLPSVDDDVDEATDSGIDQEGLSATGSGKAVDEDADPFPTSKHPDVRETLEAGDEPSTTGKPKGGKSTESSPGSKSGSGTASAGSAGAKDSATAGKGSAAGSKAAAAGEEADPDEEDEGASKDNTELVTDIEEAEADAEREAGQSAEHMHGTSTIATPT